MSSLRKKWFVAVVLPAVAVGAVLWILPVRERVDESRRVDWNTAADGSGTAYQPGAELTVNGDTTLYAQWTAQ